MQAQQAFTGRQVVDALEASGFTFQFDNTDGGFSINAPKGFDRDDVWLKRMNEQSEDVGKYLIARQEHLDRLVVLNPSRTKH